MHAGLIVDVIDHEMDTVFARSYTHDINDDGFVLGTAIGGTIEIETFAEFDCTGFGCIGEFIPHIVLVVIEEFDFDTGGLAIGTFNGDIEIEALAAINADGFLDVTVAGLNDFKLGKSTLTIHTRSVPEASTLSALGIGLFGLGLLRRRRRA